MIYETNTGVLIPHIFLWKDLHQATKYLPVYKKIQVSKLTISDLCLGIKLQQWKSQPHSKFPWCPWGEQNVSHVIKCKNFQEKCYVQKPSQV